MDEKLCELFRLLSQSIQDSRKLHPITGGMNALRREVMELDAALSGSGSVVEEAIQVATVALRIAAQDQCEPHDPDPIATEIEHLKKRIIELSNDPRGHKHEQTKERL